jgi:hypothetical protein
MVAALEKVRTLLPGIKWVQYGVPWLAAYTDGNPWVMASDEVKHRAINAQFTRDAMIVVNSDWPCPSVYMAVGERGDGGRPSPDQRKSTGARTEALV